MLSTFYCFKSVQLSKGSITTNDRDSYTNEAQTKAPGLGPKYKMSSAGDSKLFQIRILRIIYKSSKFWNRKKRGSCRASYSRDLSYAKLAVEPCRERWGRTIRLRRRRPRFGRSLLLLLLPPVDIIVIITRLQRRYVWCEKGENITQNALFHPLTGIMQNIIM